jgi:hypothetical protein
MMVNSGTFMITRVELRHLLSSFKISERNIEYILATIEKTHRHINVITLTSMLEGVGIGTDGIKEVLRRVGMDDITISMVIEMVDEHKIVAESGRIFEALVVD